MSERTMVQRLCRELRARGAHVQRIEDGVTPGVPDVNLCHRGVEAWVEAKWLVRWPVRERTPVRTSLTTAQVAWLQLRREAGGRAFLLLGVGREVLLLDGREARAVLDGLPRAELEARAVARGWEKVVGMLIGAA